MFQTFIKFIELNLRFQVINIKNQLILNDIGISTGNVNTELETTTLLPKETTTTIEDYVSYLILEKKFRNFMT